MARDDGEQRAMTSERLAEIQEHAHGSMPISIYPVQQSLLDWITAALADRFDLLAEVERRRAREAALVAVVRAVAEAPMEEIFSVDRRDYATYVLRYALGQQARALLASTERRSGGDGG